MPINPHVISKRPSDPGAAQQINDLRRQVRKNRGARNVIGAGARITGPLITTADSGSRVWLQGPTAGTPGLFAADASGTVVLGAVPGFGFVIKSGATSLNAISWVSVDPQTVVSGVTQPLGYIFCGPLDNFGSSDMNMAATATDGHGAVLLLEASSTAAGGTMYIEGETTFGVTRKATFMDHSGNGVWPGSITALSFNSTSDMYVKEGIREAHESRTSKILGIQVYTYKTKESGQRHFGVIAQEVREVYPELVHEISHPMPTEDDPKARKTLLAVDMHSMYALALAEIQRLDKRVTELEGRGK